MRASDDDRDRAAGVLNAAFAEGRLTAGEHDERLSAAYSASTSLQLRELTGDLPAPAGDTTQAIAGRGALPEPDWCLLCLLLVVCPPAGIVWWLRSRRRPLPWGGSRAQDR